jgi:uncharacterized protein (DUF433 family)
MTVVTALRRKQMEHTITVSEQTYRALQRRAEQSQKTLDALAEDWLNQHLDLERYPELEWREGPAGWRVGIKGTAIDLYAVIGYSRVGYGPQEIADELLPRLTIEQVHAALRYYAEHPDEIDRILAEAQTEASKAWLYRRLGPEGYRQVTGLSEIPRIIRESGIEYSEDSDAGEQDQTASG